MRYYYKAKNGKSWLNLKVPSYDDNPDYVSITEAEWNEHIAELEAEQQLLQQKDA